MPQYGATTLQLHTHVQAVMIWNFSPETNYLSQLWFLTVRQGKCYNSTPNYVTPSSFHVLSYSLVTSNCVIQAGHSTSNHDKVAPANAMNAYRRTDTKPHSYISAPDGSKWSALCSGWFTSRGSALVLTEWEDERASQWTGMIWRQKTCLLLLGIELCFIGHPV